jgi:glycosyltransferase involved in cell wall biosynthesis
MKLTVVSEARLLMSPDQKVWSDASDYSFLMRYLDVFDSVEFMTRVAPVSEIPSHFKRVDGPGVTSCPLPSYLGPAQYLLKSSRIKQISASVDKSAEAVLLRAPGQVANSLFRQLDKYGHPFGVEVVGDPFDVFAPGSINHPLRPFFRWWGTKRLKAQCREAVGATYVTEGVLQQRYPNPNFTTHYSDIDLLPETYAHVPKTVFGENCQFQAVFVGSLAQMYKSPDVLIEAIGRCRRQNLNVSLSILGDGKFRAQLEGQVQRLRLQEVIRFLGHLPAGQAVRAEMLGADLFILPSRTEGLPRAMIEAMACGLPCIGSSVGGIPELLPVADLVPPGDAQALADKIIQVLSDPARMRSMSARNLEKAKEYRKDILDLRRREFYLHLRSQTEAWLLARDARP